LSGKTKKKEKVGRLGKNTHNVEILVMGIEIDTIKSRRNETHVSGKPPMHIVLGERAHYGCELFKVQRPRINNGVKIGH
jgi:hypothetical protein